MAASRLIRSRFLIRGIDSPSCARKIESAVRRLPGVVEVDVSWSVGMMTVEHTDDVIVAISIERQVTVLGYKLSPIPAES